MKRFILALLTLLILSSPAFADVIHLKNGTTITGTIHELWDTYAVEGSDNVTVNMPKSKSLGETIEIKTQAGDVLTVRIEDIRRIEWSSDITALRDVPYKVEAEVLSPKPAPQVRRPPHAAMRETIMVPVEYKTAKPKKPLLAFGLSLLVPGTGQLYTGDYVDSSVHLFAATFGWDNYSRTKYEVTLFGCVGIHIISATEAFLKARRINKGRVQLGHLIEIPKDRYTLGIDPISSHGKLGTRVALRF